MFFSRAYTIVILVILLLGGVGPMDAAKRRPWVDWIHTARDLGSLVRGYCIGAHPPYVVAATAGGHRGAQRCALRSRTAVE